MGVGLAVWHLDASGVGGLEGGSNRLDQPQNGKDRDVMGILLPYLETCPLFPEIAWTRCPGMQLISYHGNHVG